MIYFLTGYVAFEEFILKFLPVSDTLYSYLRFVGEILIYVAFGKRVIHKLHRGIPFVKTAIDLPVIGFYTVVLLSILVNGSPLMGSLYNVRPLARYIVLFYLVVNSSLSERKIETFLRIILGIGIFQLTAGVIQWIGGPAAFDFFLPRESTLNIGGFTKEYRLLEIGREIGSVYGTLGDTVIYGVFMILVFIIYLSRIRRLEYLNLLGAVVLFFFIARSYSRAATFSALLAGGAWYYFHFGWKKTLRLACATALAFGLLLTVVNPFNLEYINPRKARVGLVGNVTGVFSGDYVRIAQKQRLGALIGNVPTVLVNKPILGYGADQNSAIEGLNMSQRSFLLKVLGKEGFKDVYWVAILCFYGVLGLVFFALIFYQLFRAAFNLYKRSVSTSFAGARDVISSRVTQRIANIMLCLVAVTVFLLFFNRTLEFRGYGFYFWLCAGLMFASDRALPTYKPLRITL
ncbi:hypothetical protein F4054_19490 [Candidatus Poribacteria bacterium]|nr:hypothetical protein [Candidatus Poribacteria bacterium]MYG06755.1 hypothetical protein [Candidatus Poribacteria bacterium]MYK24429.1 hypothetical protein [Candidatus Poribacteria bacterium]